MQHSPPSIVHVLPDKLGGVFTYTENLIASGASPAGLTHVILTRASGDDDALSTKRLDVASQSAVAHQLPRENLRAVLRRLARAIPAGPGVMVTNDWLELAMLSAHDIDRTVMSVIHGDYDYYYDLATRNEPSIDCFIAVSETIRERLSELMPYRRDSIVHLPTGVISPPARSGPTGIPLRLLFVGRIANPKGVFDLPAIDELLHDEKIPVAWTIVGTGPDDIRLKKSWTGRNPVQWTGQLSGTAAANLYRGHDVLVLPSRAEGMPLVLMEAMSAGVVPVVSNVSRGIAAAIARGERGFAPEPGDIAGFASAIALLAADNERFQRMSAEARDFANGHFGIERFAADFKAILSDWQGRRRPGSRRKSVPYGSRLDKPWIPNVIVRAVRTARHR